MSGIDISIIIPTYNRFWSLQQAVESCRNNQCAIEIIVVDDGSTDGTSAWLEKQSDLIVVKQPNSGKCTAVNNGFKLAKGKYIRFLDSDDMLTEHANDEQFKLAIETSADIVVSGSSDFNNKGQTLKNQLFIETDDFIAQQLGEGYGSHYSAFIFKKEFIGDIPHRADFAYRDDRLFMLEAALKNPVLAIHPGAALMHRVAHADRLQVSSGLKQQLQNSQHANLYRKVLNRLANENRLTKRRIDAATHVLWPIAHWIAIYNLAEAKKIVNYIFELNPGFIIPEKGILGTLYRNLGFTFTERILRFRRLLKKMTAGK
jgi:glycosyltransferase involved in cell wall biosynthesis